MSTVTVDEFLAHYGVKGMKWGVRKDRTYDSTEDAAARKESRKAYRKVSETVFERRYMRDSRMTQEEYEKLDRGRQFVERGATLRRVQRGTELVDKGRTYVSSLEADGALYRSIIPLNEGMFARGGKKRYKDYNELELKVTKKLTAPSEKERVDMFIELMGSPEIRIPGRSKPITGREYLKRIGYGPELRKMTNHEAGLSFYKAFNEEAGHEKRPINTAYFNKARERGYNAIADDNDRKYIAREPLILLDANNTVRVGTVRRLSADEINAGQRRIQELIYNET